MSAPAADRPRQTAAVTQGTITLLSGLGLACYRELRLKTNRRVDIMGIDAKGGLWGVEVKSCLADLHADRKWPDYLDYCDRFFFAVPEDFPQAGLSSAALGSDRAGVIVADRFGGAIIRHAPEAKLNATRRRHLLLACARTGGFRLEAAHPDAAQAAFKTSDFD